MLNVAAIPMIWGKDVASGVWIIWVSTVLKLQFIDYLATKMDSWWVGYPMKSFWPPGMYSFITILFVRNAAWLTIDMLEFLVGQLQGQCGQSEISFQQDSDDQSSLCFSAWNE